MLEIKYKELSIPSLQEWLELLEDPSIQKHMPLSVPNIDLDWVKNWLESKNLESKKSIFNLYSVWNYSKFSGWAGIQRDKEDYELSIVLKKEFWGLGKEIFNKLINDFSGSKIENSLFMYLPKTRNIQLIANRFGFKIIDEIEISGTKFSRLKIEYGILENR